MLYNLQNKITTKVEHMDTAILTLKTLFLGFFFCTSVSECLFFHILDTTLDYLFLTFKKNLTVVWDLFLNCISLITSEAEDLTFTGHLNFF